MGSGKHLNYSIKKYGIEFFKKEILFIYSSEEEMNNKEKELVTEDYCLRKDTYNICHGGFGGFGYINKNCHSNKKNHRRTGNIGFKLKLPNYKCPKRKNNISLSIKKYYKDNGSHWLGKKHKEYTKTKISMSLKGKYVGSKNSQFGTVWITNGQINKKIKKEELDFWISQGYYRGRN